MGEERYRGGWGDHDNAEIARRTMASPRTFGPGELTEREPPRFDPDLAENIAAELVEEMLPPERPAEEPPTDLSVLNAAANELMPSAEKNRIARMTWNEKISEEIRQSQGQNAPVEYDYSDDDDTTAEEYDQLASEPVEAWPESTDDAAEIDFIAQENNWIDSLGNDVEGE